MRDERVVDVPCPWGCVSALSGRAAVISVPVGNGTRERRCWNCTRAVHVVEGPGAIDSRAVHVERANVHRVHADLRPEALTDQATRKVVHPGGGATYRCDGCGRVDLWGPTWAWYGSELEQEDEGPQSYRVSCSDGCRDKALRNAPMPPQKRRRRR